MVNEVYLLSKINKNLQQRKRKSEVVSNTPISKKPKMKRSPLRQYEHDKILLENFVKYGILSDKKHPKVSAISKPAAPLSPIRTSTKHYSNNQPKPFVQNAFNIKTSTPKREFKNATIKKNPEPRRTPCSLWRPWVDSNPRPKLTVAPCPKTRHTPEDVQVVPNFNTNPQNMKPRKPFTAEVTRWDTASPEFFKAFKQPVKLMYPRSRAVDYKYSDAQQLLQAFPVQAAIGFYDDEEDEKSANRQRHLPVKKQSWNQKVPSPLGMLPERYSIKI